MLYSLLDTTSLERVLPAALRPPMWRRVSLVGMVFFYGFFVTLVVRALLSAKS